MAERSRLEKNKPEKNQDQMICQLREIKKVYRSERRKRIHGGGERREEEKRTGKEKRSRKSFRPEGPVDVGPIPRTLASGCIPITGITDGIIHTSDGRHVKIVEVLPVNFLLRSPVEQRNII